MPAQISDFTYATAPDLAVITTYFNPGNYTSRYNNYCIFRETLSRSRIPLRTIECAFGNAQFALTHFSDVTQVRCNSVLWQKERLLNHLLTSLPPSIAKVAWIDCDLLFEDPDWAINTSIALNENGLLQPFDRVHRLTASHDYGTDIGDAMLGFAREYCDPRGDRQGWHAHGHTGFAWAAKRSLIRQCGLYDASIAGSGDHLFAHAVVGEAETSCIFSRFGNQGPQYEHYAKWAQDAHSTFGGTLTYIPGTVLHLWHGEHTNRQYRERHVSLNELDFNPFTDIAISEAGCWEWCSKKPLLHQWLTMYFDSRKEDDSQHPYTTHSPERKCTHTPH